MAPSWEARYAPLASGVGALVHAQPIVDLLSGAWVVGGAAVEGAVSRLAGVA